MNTYKITRVSPAVKDVTLDHGNFKSYRFYCEGQGETVFSILQKPETAPPKAGDTFEATVKSTFDDGTVNLKKAQKQNFNGGASRGDLSPEAQARIDAVGRIKGRCHAQAVAASMLAASGDLDGLPFTDREVVGPWLNGVFRPLVDWLVSDAERARQESTPSPSANGSAQ